MCRKDRSFAYPQRIIGDAHDACDCDRPYRTVRSPVNTLARQDVHNRPGAKPPAARGCLLACSISQERAEVDRDWSETGGMYLL